ncbi:MAG: hypothetical protein JRN15_14085, partial [Nitrososphaerota archaeon]|nr:hypothetical protein [Nitrososphaerota archaeon]
MFTDLSWYNFSKPPIVENYTINLYPFRDILDGFYPFNPTTWPGSSTPSVFNLPYYLLYGSFYYLFGHDYSLAFFLTSVLFEVLGGICLFTLIMIVGRPYGLKPLFGIFGIIFYSLNAEIIVGSVWANGLFDLGSAFLPIILYLLYLSIFKSYRYFLLLGFASFFLYYSYPGGSVNGALILFEETCVAALVLILIFEWARPVSTMKKLLSGTVKFASVLFAIVLSNLYLLLPTIILLPSYLSMANTPSVYFAYGVGWDSVAKLLNSLRLLNTWVLESGALIPPWESIYLSAAWVQCLLFLFPLLAISSILITRIRSHIAIYSLFLVTVFLSKANHAPFGSIFNWLVSNVIPFKPFYNSISYYPILIFFYCLFAPITIYRLFKTLDVIYFKIKLNKSSSAISFNVDISLASLRKRKNSSNKILQTSFIFVLVVLMLASVYPILNRQIDVGTASQPMGSYIPSNYLQVNSYLDQHNGPVLVLPGTNVFNLNEYNNSSWYGGGDIYPDILNSPSTSSMYPTVNVLTTSPYQNNILSYLYSIPKYFPGFNETQNFIHEAKTGEQWLPLSITPGGAISYLNGSNSTILEMKINYSNITNPSGVWFYKPLSHPLNLSSYQYAILRLHTSGVNLTSIRFGLSFSGSAANFVGPGNWYNVGPQNGIYESFITTSSNISEVIVPLEYPSSVDGQGGLGNVVSVVLQFSPQQRNGTAHVDFYSITFSKGSVTEMSRLLSHDFAMLGYRYVLLDKSIQNTPYSYRVSNYYSSVLNNTAYFTPLFSNGSLSLYEIPSNYEIVQPAWNVVTYSNINTTLNSVYFNPTFDFNSTVSAINGTFSRPISLTKNVSLTCIQKNPDEYQVEVRSNGSFVLVLKLSYSRNFVLRTQSGTVIDTHFLA